jgi:glycine/D-amino acid oxidase-like deaminating enzyme
VRLGGLFRRRRKDIGDVTVVGSGLAAQVVALELARRSRRVTVLGRPERPAGLGLVALGPAQPYVRAVETLGREEARMLWSAGRENLGRIQTLLEEARQDLAYAARGTFLLAATRAEAETLADSEDMLRDDGFSGEFLDHYMLETHFDVSGFAGAYWAADGAELDVARLGAVVSELARAAGVVFRPASVRGIEAGRSETVAETDAGPVRAPWLVVAGDAAASALLPGLRPPLRPTTSARLRFVPEAGASLPSAARTADGAAAWQALADGVTVAATAPPSVEATVDGDGLEALGARLHPLPGTTQRWTEDEAYAFDGLPVAGRVPGQPIAVGCGFGPFAPGLVFAAARWIVDAIVEGRDPTPPPLRVGRGPAATAATGPV